MSTIDDLKKARDPSFRARAVHEVLTVERAVAPFVDLSNASILDFGCGQGVAAASFATLHPRSAVYGTDIAHIDVGHLGNLFKREVARPLPPNLTLSASPAGTLPAGWDRFELIFSWSVFEHIQFDQIETTMRLLRSRLSPGGIFFLQIEPLFFSPFGSHLRGYTGEPWAHLSCEHDALRRLVLESDGPEHRKQREWTQFESLNRATADDIESAAMAAGFVIRDQIRRKSTFRPPERLQRIFQSDTLCVEEIRLTLT